MLFDTEITYLLLYYNFWSSKFEYVETTPRKINNSDVWTTLPDWDFLYEEHPYKVTICCMRFPASYHIHKEVWYRASLKVQNIYTKSMLNLSESHSVNMENTIVKLKQNACNSEWVISFIKVLPTAHPDNNNTPPAWMSAV